VIAVVGNPTGIGWPGHCHARHPWARSLAAYKGPQAW
jgi:hypothetical protein